MSKKEVLTIEDILKRKEFFKNKKKETKKLYVKSIDSCIVVQKPDRELMYDSYEMDSKESDEYLVYESIIEPDLHSKEILDMYADEIKKPLDIVNIIFDSVEITEIAKKLAELGGYDSVSEVEEIKK